MKTLLKVIGLLFVASMCAGFVFAHLRAEERNYETRVFCETVHTGDTLDGIAEQYYNAENERMSWQEFRYKVMDDNKQLIANGRAIQPGDKVCITARVRVVKK